MNLPEGMHLAYTVTHEAWYWDAVRDARTGEHPHLMVSASTGGQGVGWEFQIDGYDLSGPVTRVKMFMDAYAALSQVPEFFAALAEQQPTTLDEVREILDGLGAVDETPRVSPYPDRPTYDRSRPCPVCGGVGSPHVAACDPD